MSDENQYIVIFGSFGRLLVAFIVSGCHLCSVVCKCRLALTQRPYNSLVECSQAVPLALSVGRGGNNLCSLHLDHSL